MGVVLEGFDPHIERRVAIKRLHSHLIVGDTKEEFLQRFKQEARIAARCSHPNIVMVLEYGEHQDTPYIVMEYVDGVSLQDLMQKKRVRLLKSAISYMAQTLKALSVAHAQGVIHRDIKPANIIVMQNGSIKLSDFGIARVPVDNNLTQTGVVVGTPRYMSPEQAMARSADQRSDLYSLTMVFAQILVGLSLPPSIPVKVLPKIKGLAKTHYINNEVPIPKVLIPIIIKGLAFDPDERIQTAKEYLTRLKSAVNALKPENNTTENNTSSSLPIDTDMATAMRKAQMNMSSIGSNELETMRTMLSNYIGSVAENIIQSEATQHREATALAHAVAAEIPDKSDRKAFITQWEAQSGQQTSTTGKAGDTARMIVSDRTSVANYLAGVDSEKLEKTFALYVGPMAGRLIKLYKGKCRTFSELIDMLTEEIPDETDKQAFLVEWHDALT